MCQGGEFCYAAAINYIMKPAGGDLASWFFFIRSKYLALHFLGIELIQIDGYQFNEIGYQFNDSKIVCCQLNESRCLPILESNVHGASTSHFHFTRQRVYTSMWQNLLAHLSHVLFSSTHGGGPDDLVKSELLGCRRLSTRRTRTIYVNEKEKERILRGVDNDVAYSQDRYIFHIVYIHHVDSVAVESMGVRVCMEWTWGCVHNLSVSR